MFIRLLIYIIAGVLIYRAAKSWFGRSIAGPGRGAAESPDRVDDVMIKDPVCGTYFPKREAVVWNGPEEALFFCSTECRDRYLATKSQK